MFNIFISSKGLKPKKRANCWVNPLGGAEKSTESFANKIDIQIVL